MSEQAAREITAAARATRKRPPRWLWITAIVVAVVCAGALAIGWLTAPDEAASTPPHGPASTTGLGIVSYLVIAVAIGVAVGIAIGRRSKSS